MGIRLGLQLWNQVFSWPEARDAVVRAEALGYDHVWTWEHALACMGDPDQATFDAYTLLTAWSQHTSRVGLGVLTGANTFWNPGLLAKKVATLDHVSAGRAIVGIGGGWFEAEHRAFGVEFGSGFGDRLAWLDESVAAIRRLLDGESVTSPTDGHYTLRDARLFPRPLQDRVPILVGGGGERKTLRTVARYADMWNWVALEDLDRMRRKHAVLEQRCEEIGRDAAEIERTAFLSPVIRDTEDEAMRFFRTQMAANRLDESVLDDSDIYVTSQERITELMIAWKEIGVSTFIIESAAPFDDETAERVATEIRSAVDSN
ncbi:MAG TPA: LLM class flavin-dependent oxidoreductase [Acidimicrobiia bacterium]|jgi:alkanesulfonate monooxygenase SsuD/methylene tetrahydromethanopterin reductase-like flavin-dependent oxidoreductase (luciferase family)